MKKYILTVLALQLLIFSCKNISNENTSESKVAKNDSLIVDSILENVKVTVANWSYNVKEDVMTSDSIYFAQNVSDELLDFKFPYDGGASVYLTLRNKEFKNSALIEISEGQFYIDITRAKLWRIRFDNNPVDYYLFNKASSGNTKVAFIARADDFIRELKKHKTVTIEAEFYQEGTRVIKFNISNLKWNH